MDQVCIAMLQRNVFVLTIFFQALSLTAQENLFENISITPATCNEDNGGINLEPLPGVLVEWLDGSEDINRNDLASGIYNLSVTDVDGCVEKVRLEVPDISNCNADVSVEYFDLPGKPSQVGPTRPCGLVQFTFTINGELVPFEYLHVLWTVTTPTPYYPGSYTYTTSDPSVPVYVFGTVVELEVELNPQLYGALSCCYFQETVYIVSPCRYISPPKVYTRKSTFSESSYGAQVPGVVELLVYGDGSCGDTTDIRGYILDDNNGELISSKDSNLVTGSSLNIDAGYVRFADRANWADVPNGSLITLFDPNHALNDSLALLADPTDSNNDFHYIVSIEDSTYLEGKNTTWVYGKQSITYDSTDTPLSWSLIEPDGEAGAIQVRYPNGDYCHGFSFGETGTSSDPNSFPLHITEEDHLYGQIHMEQLSYLDKSAFTFYAQTGGFEAGLLGDSTLENMILYLRDCNFQPLVFMPPGNDPNLLQDEILERVFQTKMADQYFKVFPNPFERYLQVQFQCPFQGEGTIRVFNSRGMLIINHPVQCTGEEQTITLDFDEVAANGLYLVQFQTPDKQMWIEKVTLINLK
jgi:hypothetical protein